ncbi:hypothetical protein M0R45_020920 [Rubus argutus]|uniref:MSP domain-containing protein n=1 Tax=Rubus argutus TaxID=59490 RepID=A0AAW1XBP5_RUBAR
MGALWLFGEIKFELKKQSSCSLQLTNKTVKYMAFKVKIINPKKYCVRPNAECYCYCVRKITMQAQKESPPDMLCRDKFLLQSVVAPDGSTTKDITAEMFNKEDGKVVEEAVVENGNQISSVFDAVSRSPEEPKEKSSEVSSP